LKKQNNGLTRDKFCKDAEGNVVGCPNCESTDLRKDGFQYWKNNRKRQRFYCNSCFKKTIAPEIIEENKFARMVEPDEDIDIKELIKYRNKRYNKKYSAYEQKKLIDIAININGPIGICHFGDPHVDDDGTNLAEIFDLCDLIESTDGMFAGNLGDVQNNWVGRLQALHGQQATTAKESWALTEYFLEKLTWLYLIAGNHDVWSGDGDPLDFIMRGKPTIYQQHGARMNLVFPNGRTVRINALPIADVSQFSSAEVLLIILLSYTSSACPVYMLSFTETVAFITTLFSSVKHILVLMLFTASLCSS
jgi:hypothetical protein